MRQGSKFRDMDVTLLKGRCNPWIRLTKQEVFVRRHNEHGEGGGSLDDEELQRLIVDGLENDRALWLNRKVRKIMIIVEVDEGYVTLSGIARSPLERRRADILARALGAAGVDNRLRVEGQERSS